MRDSDLKAEKYTEFKNKFYETCKSIHRDSRLIKKTDAFKGKYLPLDETLNIVYDACDKNGLIFRQYFSLNNGQNVIITTVTLKEDHDFSLRSEYLVPHKEELMLDNTINFSKFGSRDTYLRRYALMATFGACPRGEDKDAWDSINPSKNKETIKLKEGGAAAEKSNTEIDELVNLLVEKAGRDKKTIISWVKRQDPEFALQKLREAAAPFRG